MKLKNIISLKELIAVLLAVIVLSFSNSFTNFSLFRKSFIFFAIILSLHIASKKYMAYYLQAEEEHKIWTFQRWGFYTRSYFKHPIPIGIILPFLLTILSLGYVKWFAVTESEIKPTSARAAKRHGLIRFSEMTEWHIALISAAGILSMFPLSFIAYLIGYSDMARLCIYFAVFNLLPLGKLDGTKIFFGSRILYAVLVAMALIGLAYIFLLV